MSGMRLLVAGARGPLASALIAGARDAGHECVWWEWCERSAGEAEAGQLVAPLAAAAEVVREVAPDAVVQLPWGAVGARRGARLEAALAATARAAGGLGARMLLWQGAEIYGSVQQLPTRPRSEDAAVGDTAPARRSHRRERLLLGVAADSALRPVLLRAVPVADAAAPPLAPLLHLRLWPWAPAHRPLQLLDARDAAGALLAALRAPGAGPYNVAPDGVLLYTTARRAIGAVAAPWPATLVRRGIAPAALASAWRWLTCAPVLDNGRLKSRLGYRPQRSSAEALAAALAPGRVSNAR